MTHPAFPRATELAHRLALEHIREGDVVVDATAGNGHDTLFLARAAGSGGRVIALDIQEKAIEAARLRIDSARDAGEALARVDLHLFGHERLGELWAEQVLPAPGAILFNLGYRPGGDKTIVTGPDTTLAGLDAATALLARHGILTVVLYPGHPGGAAEADAVRHWAAELDQARHQTVHYRFLNLRNAPPELVAVRRIDSASRPAVG